MVVWFTRNCVCLFRVAPFVLLELEHWLDRRPRLSASIPFGCTKNEISRLIEAVLNREFEADVGHCAHYVRSQVFYGGWQFSWLGLEFDCGWAAWFDNCLSRIQSRNDDGEIVYEGRVFESEKRKNQQVVLGWESVANRYCICAWDRADARRSIEAVGCQTGSFRVYRCCQR